MPPILGNCVALLLVGLLVYACARYLWKDMKSGGGCASCGGHCAGGCAGGACASCGGTCGNGQFDSASMPKIDVSALRIHRDGSGNT